jgi:hypothetical protein
MRELHILGMLRHSAELEVHKAELLQVHTQRSLLPLIMAKSYMQAFPPKEQYSALYSTSKILTNRVLYRTISKL